MHIALETPPGPLPIIILRQGNLLKVDVEPMALSRLQQPAAGQVVAVAVGEARGHDAADGHVPDHTATHSWQREPERERNKERWTINIATPRGNIEGRKQIIRTIVVILHSRRQALQSTLRPKQIFYRIAIAIVRIERNCILDVIYAWCCVLKDWGKCNPKYWAFGMYNTK